MSGKSSEISLAGRLRRYLSLTLLGVGIGIFIAFAALAIALIQQERRTGVQTLGSTLVRLISRPLSQGDYFQVEDSLRGTILPEYVRGVEVVSVQGETIAVGRRSEAEPARELRLSIPIGDVSSRPVLVLHWNNADLIDKFGFWAAIALACLLPIYALVRWVTIVGIRVSLKPLRQSIDAAASDSAALSSVARDAPTEIRPVLERLTMIQRELSRKSMDAEIGRVSSQLAHDLRSPLTALDLLLSSLTSLPEKERVLLRNSIHRMRDICHTLLATTKVSPNAGNISANADVQRAELLGPLIETVIAENRLRFHRRGGARIAYPNPKQAFGIFSAVEAGEFQRAVSNLIGNAGEAIDDKGDVTVSIGLNADGILSLEVRDTGRGIPLEVLEKLGKRGATFNKRDGTGLGVWHCRAAVESWGGSLTIQSVLGTGTVATIKLPTAPVPDWFAKEIRVPVGGQVVVLDDDQSIHGVWSERFHTLAITPRGFSDVEEFSLRVKEHRTETDLFLVDYELIGSITNGLALIEELGIAHRSVLVTSRFDEAAVQSEAERIELKILPKALAPFVPIAVDIDSKDGEVILIDNDALVRSAWMYSAETRGKNLRTFSSASEFLSEMEVISREATIYIDECLGDGTKGHEIAKQLHTAGFKRLFLATGVTPDCIPRFPWLAGIVGKEIPWTT